MSIIVFGSLAYDYIMNFPDRFKNHILPDQIHILNVCFVVDEVRKNFGGCAGNIAYTIKLLGVDPIILSTLGDDGQDYLKHLDKLGIGKKYIKIVGEKNTSVAYMTTDSDDNQIVAYCNGAGDAALDLSLADIKEESDLVLITPTKKEAMIKHAREAKEGRMPLIFDPSHQLSVFTKEELVEIISGVKFFIGNDYEMKLVFDKTGWSKEELLDKVDVLITTLGGEGSLIETKKESIKVGICKAESTDDPTGAGDAYRAGFFAAYSKGCDLKTCGQTGAVAAAYTVEKYGTQTHSFTISEFKARYKEAFGEELIFKT